MKYLMAGSGRLPGAANTVIGMTMAALLILALPPACRGSQIAGSDSASLTDLSIEDLMNVKVTSVSKKPEKMWEAASAVYVITQDDLRRTGATSVMEALRGVPGMQVARLNSSSWAISARGFNQEFADKMLVLVDGISVYDPIFSGVFWMNQDLMLEDIDRIEIIRGPGAAVWGANAVNGVINIITKAAVDTQGLLVASTVGTPDISLDRLRFGGQLGDKSSYRVYGLYSDHGAQVDASGQDAGDDWWSWRSGFRVDTRQSVRSSTTIQGNVYSARARQNVPVISLVTPPFLTRTVDNAKLNASDLLAKWNNTTANGADDMLQLYYNSSDHRSIAGVENRNTWDLEFQRHAPRSKRHDILWGLGYRLISDDSVGGNLYVANPEKLTTQLASAFLQDEITIKPERLRLIAGSKLEHNSYTGLEVLPNGRLLWTPNKRETGWASISRAVRTPSRRDETYDLTIRASSEPPGGPIPEGTPVVTTLDSNPDLDSEDLVAYELGYRTRPSAGLSFDVAAFYNKYTNLITTQLGTPYFDGSLDPPRMVIPLHWVNGQHGSTYGVEIASNWDITDAWRLKIGYSTLKEHLVSENPPFTRSGNGANPAHQGFLRSSWDIGPKLDLDTLVTYVDSIKNETSGAVIPAYARVDLRLGWKRSPSQEWSLVVQNLTTRRHSEMFSVWSAPTEVERSLFLKITWSH